jgi:hypothetical protein
LHLSDEGELAELTLAAQVYLEHLWRHILCRHLTLIHCCEQEFAEPCCWGNQFTDDVYLRQNLTTSFLLRAYVYSSITPKWKSGRGILLPEKDLMADSKAPVAGSDKQSEGSTRRSHGGSPAAGTDNAPAIAKPSASPLPDQEFTSFPISCTVNLLNFFYYDI